MRVLLTAVVVVLLLGSACARAPRQPTQPSDPVPVQPREEEPPKIVAPPPTAIGPPRQSQPPEGPVKAPEAPEQTEEPQRPAQQQPPPPMAEGIEFQVTLEGVQSPGFFGPGALGRVGAGAFRVTVRLPAPMTQEAALRAISVEGSPFEVTGWHEPTHSVGLRMAQGAPGQTVTVRVVLGGESHVLRLQRVPEALVVLERQVGETDQWQAVKPWETAPPGSTTLRLRFSKPVDTDSVVRALQTAQSDPVRGLFNWVDSQTLLWHIPELPSHLVFLLGGARDQDGLPLPGGIPVIRVGEPATLNLYVVDSNVEGELLPVPSDPVRAMLLPDGKVIELWAWTPGRTQWDWTQTSYSIDLMRFSVAAGAPPRDPRVSRIPTDMLAVSISPDGAFAVGFRGKDLSLVDISSGRERRFAGFLHQEAPPSAPAWSFDGKRVVVLDGPDLVQLTIDTWERTVLIAALPTDGGVYLNGSSDGRYMLVGSLVVDLAQKSFIRLPGDPLSARGTWEPDGVRLAYTGGDWSEIHLYEPLTGNRHALGRGYIVEWASPGRLYLLRRPTDDNRYFPPGGLMINDPGQ